MKHKIFPFLKAVILVLSIAALTLRCADLKLDKQENVSSSIAKEMGANEEEVRMLALNFFSSKGTLSKLRTTDKSSDDKEILSVYTIKDLEGDVL